MPFQDKAGQKLPSVTFKIREGSQWKEKTTEDFFKGKKVVVFALPGAFTPTCSSTHLPRYNELADSFKQAGVDDIICLSVNDSFVMNDWKEEQKADKITMLPDGNGEFSEKMGFLVDKSDLGFGKRSWRYSMLVVDGVVEKMFIEEEVEGDPYGKSDADTMLGYLKGRAPESIAMFTRPGCPFCDEAKDLLRQRHLPFEELVLNKDYTIKTLMAVSGAAKVPQIFIQGERVGGAAELKKRLQAQV